MVGLILGAASTLITGFFKFGGLLSGGAKLAFVSDPDEDGVEAFLRDASKGGPNCDLSLALLVVLFRDDIV